MPAARAARRSRLASAPAALARAASPGSRRATSRCATTSNCWSTPASSTCRCQGWPIADSDLAHALSNDHAATDSMRRAVGSGKAGLTAPQQAAVARLRRHRLARARRLSVSNSCGGAPHDTCARSRTRRAKKAKSAAYAAGFVGDRFGGRLEVTAVADPDDDKDRPSRRLVRRRPSSATGSSRSARRIAGGARAGKAA